MPLYTIRHALIADAANLAALAAKTFAETFGKDNTAEDLLLHLRSAYGVAQQSGEIADPQVVTLLGFEGEDLVGFAQVRKGTAPSCVVGDGPVELQRLYVAVSHQGTGLAAKLMQGARLAGLEFGGTHLWLGVWERNPRAIAFYRKAGFVEVGSHVFVLGGDEQRDLVFVDSLVPSSKSAA
jgi:diamine N-acetyltransferase